MVVAEGRYHLVCIPDGGEAQDVLQAAIIPLLGDRRVLIAALIYGEAVVEVDDPVLDKNIEGEFGAWGEEDSVQVGALDVFGIADPGREIERIPLRNLRRHRRAGLG